MERRSVEKAVVERGEQEACICRFHLLPGQQKKNTCLGLCKRPSALPRLRFATYMRSAHDVACQPPLGSVEALTEELGALKMKIERLRAAEAAAEVDVAARREALTAAADALLDEWLPLPEDAVLAALPASPSKPSPSPTVSAAKAPTRKLHPRAAALAASLLPTPYERRRL